MKSKSKNKAIKGRRNRCHALRFIVKYPLYDMSAAATAREIMGKLLNSTACAMSMESRFEISNVITVKRPRFIS